MREVFEKVFRELCSSLKEKYPQTPSWRLAYQVWRVLRNEVDKALILYLLEERDMGCPKCRGGEIVKHTCGERTFRCVNCGFIAPLEVFFLGLPSQRDKNGT